MAGPQGSQGTAGQAAPAGAIIGQLQHCAPNTNFTGYLVHIPGRAFSVFTGPDGSFQIDNVPAGTYSVAVEFTGISESVQNIVVTDAPVTLDPISVGTCAPACVAGQACNTGLIGVCATGVTVCNGGVSSCQASIAPSAEVCDGLDNNCNGIVDDGNPGGGMACNTGLPGTCGAGTSVCQNGVVSCNANAQPAAEVCDGLDNNCNGSIDEGVRTTFYRDADGDGFGNPSVSQQACSRPAGYVSNNTDCNDSNSARHPGATEVCNGIDDNCNASIDDGASCPAFPNATSACQFGACGFACNANFANCDGAIGTGCEVDTRTNTAHCGACGNACGAGQTCVSGTCSGVNDDAWKQWQ